MGQRLVLRANEEVSISELEEFAKKAKEYGLNGKNLAKIEITEEANEGEEDFTYSLRLVCELPEGVRVAAGKKHIVRPKTKKQVEVEKQITEHKEKKENGEKQAHVPPAGQKGPTKVRKVKCPVCNVRKPVVKRAGISVIKPHVVKGEPCAGSGEQVASKRRKSASGDSGDS